MSKKRVTVFEALQTEIMSDILNRSDMSFFRKVCRWYSSTFHTPLHIVMDCKVIQWDDILVHYYEDQMESFGYNTVFEIATREYIPELAEEFEEDNKEFARALVKEQKATLAKQEAKTKKVSSTTKKISQEEQIKPDNKELTPPAPVKMSFDDEEDNE